MIGIVCGVAAVVAMLAVGEGASFETQERIKNLGSQNIILKSVKPTEEFNKPPTRRGFSSAEYGLNDTDIARIKRTIQGVVLHIPIWETIKRIGNGKRQMDSLIRGTTPDYMHAVNQMLKYGRFFTPLDMGYRQSVCVIDHGIQQKIFPYQDPLGKLLKIGKHYYRIVGVVKSMGSDDLIQKKQANIPSVYIPLTSARARFGKMTMKRKTGSLEVETVELHRLILKVNKQADVIPVSEMIIRLMERFHADKDYEIIVPLRLLEEVKKNARMFSIVLGMIAAISLLVGGVGIMNIMLANIIERTPEIGIRRALGAKKRNIISQFLSETVVLSFCGGILGLVFGIILPLGIEFITGMKVIFTLSSFVFSFFISVLVGIVFGIYPAYRAANMDPIQALKRL